MAKQRTETSAFGVSKRQAHDASNFYARQLYSQPAEPVAASPEPGAAAAGSAPSAADSDWVNRIYCQSAVKMQQAPSDSVGVAFTSPPYNVGKEYDHDLSLDDYLALM